MTTGPISPTAENLDPNLNWDISTPRNSVSDTAAKVHFHSPNVSPEKKGRPSPEKKRSPEKASQSPALLSLPPRRLFFAGPISPSLTAALDDDEPIKVTPITIDTDGETSESEEETVAPKPVVVQTLPPRPLALKLDLSQEYEKPPESQTRHTEEFAWMNRQITPRVLGRSLNEREQQFVQQVQEASKMGPIGVKHLQRGTYLIRFMNEAVYELLATPTVAQCIAEYAEMTPEALTNANTSPLAIFKPGDEVRGAPNAKRQTSDGGGAKAGVSPWLEIPNEIIAAALGNLNQMVIGLSLTNAAFRDPSQGTKAKTKYGVAISFMPMMSLTAITDQHLRKRAIATMSVRDFQNMAIMDLKLCNSDRNASNLLVAKDALQRFQTHQPKRRRIEQKPSLHGGEICPIDHANILPEGFASPANFVWMQWQMAHLPFNKTSKRAIAALNAEADIAKIQEAYPNYPQANLNIMRMTYHLLQEGARNNLTPFQIGLFFGSAEENLSFFLARLLLHAENVHESLPEPKPPIHGLVNRSLTATIDYAKANGLLASQDTWDRSFSPLIQFAKAQIKE